MEGLAENIFNNKNINIYRTNINKKENFNKIVFIPIIKKSIFIKKYSFIINFILIEIFFILLSIVICNEQHYVEIKVNKIGYIQIISDEYKGILPNKIIIDNIILSEINKTININSTDNSILLIYNKAISDYSFMFSNLKNIVQVHMNNTFGKDNNMSYMFYNCYNLEIFTYEIDYSISHTIIDMKNMFYNCLSLQSFKFKDLYMDYSKFYQTSSYDRQKSQDVTTDNYDYNKISMSYMFYNCQSLKSIYLDSNIRKYIIDMTKMFYNCFSLVSLNLAYIKTNSYIDTSYMFYNCTNLEYFYSNNSDIDAKDMKNMFYNCISLKSVDLSGFNNYYNSINMSNSFYNCYSLNTITGFYNLYISDTDNMFYNCSCLTYLNFNPRKVESKSNMEKMFYNCTQLKTLIFDLYTSSSSSSSSDNFNPININNIFYNCFSLENLNFNYFRTDYIYEINNLFYFNKKLKSITITKNSFTNELITNMKGIFKDLTSLISLDLSSFNTKNVEIMWDMFKNCKSLKYLDLSNFDTSKVTDMESMFEDCISLISLNIKNFNTPKVRYMNKMFKNCINLKSLYFNNINSESLGTMQQMLYNCKNLEYLNFYLLTENVQSIIEMFEGVSDNFTFCIKEHENIPKIFAEINKRINTKRDCSDLCYGNGNKRPIIIERKICCPKYEYNGTCYNKCPKRMKASNEDKICKPFYCSPNYYNYEQDDCINTIPEGYYENDTQLKTIDKCYKSCRSCSQAPTRTKQYCIKCNETNYPYFYFDNCLSSCENGFYTDDTGILKCKCITEECSDCTEESLEEGLCVSCNEGYYPKSDDILYLNNYKKCHKDPPKYYLNNNELIYQPCYSSCQECYGSGNQSFHNCSICDSKNNFMLIKNISGYISNNCYQNCSYYYYFDNNNQYQCTIIDECPQDFIYLVVELRQCVQSCNDVQGYNKILRYECYKECPSGISLQSEFDPNKCKSQCSFDYPFILINKDKCVASCSIIERSQKLCITSYFENRTNLEIQEIIHNDINRDLLNKFNYSIITENNTVIIEENKTVYEILTTRNKNPNSNTTSINLGECETRLKEYYDIDQNDYLYILVIDAYIEGKTGPVPLYEVYYPLFNSPTLFQLDLSICEGLQISMLYNMALENPELYDKDNPIYNDMCYPYSSKEGVDMILTDVQQEFKDNNKIICDEGCKFEYINNKVECNCDIQTSFPPLSEIKIDKDKLYKFANIKNLANFGVLKCANLLTIKERMIANIGIYSFIPTIIAYIVCIILFYKFDFKIIKEKIKEILYAILNLKYIKKEKEKADKPINIKQEYNFEPIFVSLAKAKDVEIPDVIMKEINDIKNKKLNLIEINPINNLKKKFSSEGKKEDLSKSDVNLNDNNDIVIFKKKSKYSINLKKDNNNLNNKNNNHKQLSEKIGVKSNKDKKKLYKDNKKLSEKEIKKILDILAYNDKELNDLNFNLALKYDNRNFIKIYYSFLKTDHLIIKILNSNDYNSLFIKIFLCFYNFSLSYTINALFFDDDTIHQILEDEGKFNFFYQLPQIIYSSIISYFFGIILDFLALSEDNILELKALRVPNKAIQKAKELLRILKIKFIFFFVLSIIFILFFWYYLICFSAVYKNTQYHVIKDNIIGFATGLLTPFGMKLIPLLFRVIGLKGKNKYFFLISKYMQIFI